jgi:asparagine synthase (glutamine-hydrolysing)
MCGIAGWVSFKRDLQAHRDVLQRMTDTMSLRGPDAGGLWIDGHAGLGHRRLSIIDLVGGVQPMQAGEGGETAAVLTYSGEVYNFVELREQLRTLGHGFATRSDTEVVLRAYLQWGEAFVTRLNGMYAFAIWDVRAQELLLVRDRMGVKPLFYYPTSDGVLFGSEPKAILAHPEIRARVDEDGFREALQFVRIQERPIYSGMREVLPGQIVRVDRSGVHRRTYWKLEASEHRDDLTRTVDTVRALLNDIVRTQIVADVPLCSLLSGGLDSSVVTSLANRFLSRDGSGVRSFSVDFVQHGDGFVANDFHKTADAPFVRLLADELGLDHTEIVLESAGLANRELRRAAVRAADAPFAFSAEMFTSLYRLFEAVRGRSTVALSGESADELFGGYPWFHRPESVAEECYPWQSGPFKNLSNNWSLLDPGLLARLRLDDYANDCYRDDIAACPILPGESGLQRRQREIGHLHLTRMVRALLDRKDRMSMAVGLEVRVPFCDHRLVEYVFNVPWSMKTFDGREKSILRAAGRDLLPRAILERQKSPYPSTQDPAYETALREELRMLASDRSAPVAQFLNKGAVAQLLAAPAGGKTSMMSRVALDSVISLNDWLACSGVSCEL